MNYGFKIFIAEDFYQDLLSGLAVAIVIHLLDPCCREQ